MLTGPFDAASEEQPARYRGLSEPVPTQPSPSQPNLLPGRVLHGLCGKEEAEKRNGRIRLARCAIHKNDPNKHIRVMCLEVPGAETEEQKEYKWQMARKQGECKAECVFSSSLHSLMSRLWLIYFSFCHQ